MLICALRRLASICNGLVITDQVSIETRHISTQIDENGLALAISWGRLRSGGRCWLLLFDDSGFGGHFLICILCIGARMPASPELPSLGFGIDIFDLPPFFLVPRIMQRAVMNGAKRHGPFIADFASQCAGLRKAQVMGVAWAAAAEEAWQ